MKTEHYKSWVETLKQRWIEHGAYRPPLVGCRDEDLAAMCAAQGVNSLPALYVEFMRVFGRESGGLTTGDGPFVFPEVLDFKRHWEGVVPTQDCFVFWTNYSEIAAFFHTGPQTDDPLIYLIVEASDDAELRLVIQQEGLLSELILDWVEDLIEVRQKWKPKTGE